MKGKDSSILINGGLSYIVPNVLKQMSDFGIDPGKIKKLLILHSHFDHIGIVPFFKRTFPKIEVLASRRAWEILAMPKAIRYSKHIQQDRLPGKWGAAGLEKYDLDWRDDVTGRPSSKGT